MTSLCLNCIKKGNGCKLSLPASVTIQDCENFKSMLDRDREILIIKHDIQKIKCQLDDVLARLQG